MEKSKELSIIICSGCGKAASGNAKKCQRCGVVMGNPYEEAITEMQKYEEGCEPRSYKEYDEEG